MKLNNTLLILVLVFSVISCKKEVNYDLEKDYFEEKNKVVYYKGSPFNGILIKTTKTEIWDDDGTKQEEVTLIERTPFNEGKIDGIQTSMIDSKTLFSEIDYVLNIKKNEKYYYSSGNIAYITTFNSKTNEWDKKQSYYKNGKLKEEEFYDYQNNRVVNNYYKSGKIKQENYTDGKNNRVFKKYYEDGNLHKSEYTDDNSNYIEVSYNESNQKYLKRFNNIIYEYEYQEDGKLWLVRVKKLRSGEMKEVWFYNGKDYIMSKQIMIPRTNTYKLINYNEKGEITYEGIDYLSFD